MSTELPYLPSYKNVSRLFDKIRAARIPESFTQQYLYKTLGIKGVKGSKDKAKKEERKKAKLTPKEKRQKKREKKDK